MSNFSQKCLFFLPTSERAGEVGVTPLAASAALWLRSGEQLQQSAGREESHAVYGRDCAQVGDDTDAEEDFTRVS